MPAAVNPIVSANPAVYALAKAGAVIPHPGRREGNQP
jgi:hypothetical protein